MHYVAAVRASRPAHGTLVSHSSRRIAAARRVAARTVVESHVLARHVAAALAGEDLRIRGGLVALERQEEAAVCGHGADFTFQSLRCIEFIQSLSW